ncbi:hypothetical protein M2137_002369 [Parabacteroides sp. PFB2-10]|uniref:hypothetical protein n=1 Tax=Parabacteroides sp. PFB2-10 TaxID=1742405 RepID=UPI0024768B39|nr:hypothetical protein [Parabacteroides sp. PFB2-10]MDH6313579.1 hypothetical protein [Parabacteroides sp. PFB2-10]MDL2245296.1 hypothetical protein [Parabacteroides sp. OttesenSCG-928-J18]
MRQTLYIIALCCLTLLFGCNDEEDTPIPTKRPEKARVELSGSLPAPGIPTRADDEYNDPGGMIHPIPNSDGLPPYQLKIGIVTIEFGSYENNTPPTVAEWNDPTTYLDYGFFGGQSPNDKPGNYTEEASDDPITPDPHAGATGPTVWTGNIEYTNRKGDAIQQVFYDEMGIYYYMVAFYPYHAIYDIENVEEDENGTIIWDDVLGAAVVFEVDGSQDIMASTMGGGNIEHPFTEALTFSHKLTALRCHFFAESALAKSLYGTIDSVKLINQPKRIGLNIGKQADAGKYDDELFDAERGLTTEYPAVRPKDTNGNPVTGSLSLPTTYATAAAVEFGYMLAMPAQTYTFSIFTSIRGKNNPVYVTYDFDPEKTGVMPLAGKIYNLAFKLLETAEIRLEAAEAEEWWFDQRYD